MSQQGRDESAEEQEIQGNDEHTIEPERDEVVQDMSSFLRRFESNGWKSKLGKRQTIEDITDKLLSQLTLASEALLDNLFRYLSELPEHDTAENDNDQNQAIVTGLTLPASAVGWISTQIFSEHQEDSRLYDERSMGSVLSASLRDRLSLLRYLLPRATHIRITSETWPPKTKKKEKKRYNNAVNTTLLSALTDDVQASTFLEYYDRIKNRPAVDLRVFPNCRVLLLEQVPAEWIVHLTAIRQSLQVLRIDRCCINNILSLLLDVEEAIDERDPLSCIDLQQSIYPNLTHLKVSSCDLDENSGLNVNAPLSRLPSLRYLSLAHNALETQASALAGLSSMSFLTKLDLSHNFIRSLSKAYQNLGNLQTLVLSYNQIRNVTGIDRLYSLKHLHIDHNKISDITAMSGLARLPELVVLYLQGNPIQERSPKSYRFEVFNLFRESRFPTLPQNATFRQLQEVLPLLDGKPVSVRELKALRSRTFREVSTVQSDTTEASFRQQVEPQPVHREQKRRVATIQLEHNLGHVNIQDVEPSYKPIAMFTVTDVLQSLVVQEKDESGKEKESNKERLLLTDTDRFKSDIRVETLDTLGANTLEKVEESSEEDTIEDIATPGKSHDQGQVSEEIANVANNGNADLISDDVPAKTSTDHQMTLNEDEHFSELHSCDLSPVRHEWPESTLKGSGATAVTAAETDTDPTNYDGVVIKEIEHVSTHSSNFTTPTKTLPKEEVEVRNASEYQTPESSGACQGLDQSESPTSMSSPSAIQLPWRTVSFPENVWQDDSLSVPSSIATPHRDDTAFNAKFYLAESKSRYEGPEKDKQLYVHENLELYFRSFVFRMTTPSSSTSMMNSQSPSITNDADEEGWQHVLERYPKIQLWPVDRRTKEATIVENEQLAMKPDSHEDFRRTWKENIIGCGRPAVKRLTPNRAARYGFHGELLWSSGATHLKPETIVEARQSIICFSDTAMYIILDHDAVTLKARDQKRKFPLPIPLDAVFVEAKWPHALARHAFQFLRTITIGFGFQRLALRFANVNSPSSDDFTYILLTSNKMETIAIVKELQELSTEARLTSNIGIDDEDPVTIENDDRHTLDALSVAVSPDQIGMVIHYQILKQYWRRGERGTVRRVCLVTDTKLYLLDEDYAGDGSESFDSGSSELGSTMYRLVDSASLSQIEGVYVSDSNPMAISISIRPTSSFQRKRNWRFICRDRSGAEGLVEDVRKAVSHVDVYCN